MLQYTFGAMTANRKKLLEKIAEFRDSKVKDEQGAKDKLEELHKFLTDHETVSPSDCTHEVLNGFGDSWSTNRLGIAEENTIYEMGVPRTLGETRTPQFKHLQDIEIRGTKDDDVKPEELIGEEKKILRMLERK